MALLAAGVVATLAVLDVRDWRCYGLAFLWPPVLSAIQTGNVTIPLALSAALVWRFRDRSTVSGVCLGVSMAAKSSSGRCSSGSPQRGGSGPS